MVYTYIQIIINSIFSANFLTRLFACLIIETFVTVTAILHSGPLAPVSAGPDGKMIYTSDSMGNRIPDFSYCGYMAAEKPIPDAPVRIIVPVKSGDATARIQSAINYVSSWPADSNGIRGAVLLEKGRYEVYGSLKINSSGVILRGSGMDENGTVLMALGKDRKTLISIAGKNDKELKPGVAIIDAYVPVNAKRIRVSASHSFKAGDMVIVHRPCTQKWIQKLGMDNLGGESRWLRWKPGERVLNWYRTVVSVEGNTLSLDAPITTALDTSYGGGTVAACHWPGRISQTGVENICCVSAYDVNNPKDENHRWMAITMENVYDGWVRQIVFKHFAGSAVAIYETAGRITVEDCKSLSPVSEIGGQRRYTFFTGGQQTLFQRIYAEYGYHDFATGFCAAGPNAFVQCESHLPYNFSGAIDSWASGVLFDVVNIDGQPLSLFNRGQNAQGAGWSGANSVIWQCTASEISCYSPPTANNWTIGSWSQFAGDGYFGSSNSFVQPRSLYYGQLADRLGDSVLYRAQLLPVETKSTTSPTVDQAVSLTRESENPSMRLSEWIDMAPRRQPVPVNTQGIKSIDRILGSEPAFKEEASEMLILNGWLVRDSIILTGNWHKVSWWRGSIRPYGIKKASPHITRFVPGRTGTGLTDNLNELTEWMKNQHIIALEHNYGLWYDRRRDDHQRIRRMDSEVWPPFYELPFMRSGQGTAWDGLSKYDLTKYNNWYWMRLKQFADLADQKGLILIHQNYFQHNILEAGAHWTDFPWRTANNINSAGFPEPPPYAGDKRIFMADQFYDVAHKERHKLHKAYIRKCLENFADNNGVIQFIGKEFTGPLHFVQFWIDVIMEWEKETGKKAFVGLSVTKDVQDLILTDPVRNSAISVIDIRYWQYLKDGSLYAPEGGKNLAPRQHARLMKPGKSSFKQVYRAVLEYRKRFPDKAVIYSTDRNNIFSWAVFMAGGSLAAIPVIADSGFLADAATMQPVDLPGNPENQWALGNTQKGYIIYNNSNDPVKLDLSTSNAMFRIRRIDPKDGRMLDKEEKVEGGKILKMKNMLSGPVVMWITRL